MNVDEVRARCEHAQQSQNHVSHWTHIELETIERLARSDLPEALDAIESLTAERDALREALTAIVALHGYHTEDVYLEHDDEPDDSLTAIESCDECGVEDDVGFVRHLVWPCPTVTIARAVLPSTKGEDA